MSLESEIKKTKDCLSFTVAEMGGLSIFQRKNLITIMRMSYYLGMLEYSKEHNRIVKLFEGKDDDE